METRTLSTIAVALLLPLTACGDDADDGMVGTEHDAGAHATRLDGASSDGCRTQADCDDDERCAKDACSAATGTCTARPGECPLEIDPVCGCDGETYDNACLAAEAGASVAHEDACDCSTSEDCGPLDYCRKTGCAAPAGECTPRPQACPAVVDPVCGCAGETYGNDCAAYEAGVNVAADGPC